MFSLVPSWVDCTWWVDTLAQFLWGEGHMNSLPCAWMLYVPCPYVLLEELPLPPFVLHLWSLKCRYMSGQLQVTRTKCFHVQHSMTKGSWWLCSALLHCPCLRSLWVLYAVPFSQGT